MSKIQERMATCIALATAIFAAAETAGRELTPEEVGQKDKIFAELKGLKATVEGQKELAALGFAQLLDPVTGKSKAELEAEGKPADRDPIKVREAYNKYLRTGERGDLFVITTGSGSGAMLPTEVATPTIVRRIYNSLEAAVASRGYQPIMTDSSDTWSLPVMDDTTVTGQVTAQDASGDIAADPVVTNLSLGANLYDSKSIWLSNTQVNAVGWDLVGYLQPILEKRIDLTQDAAWIAKLLTKATAGNTITTAATTGITYAEHVAFYHKLPVPYRPDGVYIMSDDLLKVFESLTDNYGRPLLSDPLVDGAINTLRGCPVFVSLNMHTPAAGQISGAFASAEALKIRLVRNKRIARYVDSPAYPDQVGFREFENGDFDALSQGLAFLKHAAS